MTSSEGVSVRRLGDVSPHESYLGTSGRDYVDPSPLVLWGGGTRPAAVLHLEVKTRGRRAVQAIAPVDRSVKLPGFPVTYQIDLPPDARSEEVVDSIDTRALITADVDGDGVQELVVTRRQGGVSMHGVRGQHAEYPSPAGGPGGVKYKRFLAHTMNLGSRDVVYVLSVCDAPGADRNLLLRVDGRGVTRIRPEGLEKAQILALGAIQRTGSQDVDELLILTADGERDAALGRYRPDGKRIEPARRMYVRPSRECAFRFVPSASKAVLEVAGGVLVLSPEKPANWIREIKVNGKVDPRELDIAFVADLESDPKMVYSDGDALWAVDHDGKCFAPAGGGRWTASAKPGPYMHVPVPPGEKLWLVWKAEAGKLFAVSSGERGTRPLTHDEWAQAADRYLPPDEAAVWRKQRQPSLEGEHGYRDVSIKEEREDRHVDAPVRTVDEWKRLLPRSYAEVLKYDATDHDVEVARRLRALAENPKEAGKVPDPAGLRAFLDGIQVPARTTFMAIDGPAVSSVTVPGSPMRMLESQVGGGVEYRLHDARITAIVTLEKGDAEGRAPPAFYEVDAALAARR
jgi:hypothetical protein